MFGNLASAGTRGRAIAAAIVGAALLLASALLAPTSAHAEDNGAWSVAPTPPKGGSSTPRDYFIVEGDPGTKIKDKVRIQNWTDKTLTFHLYGADGFNTEQDGFFALKGYTAKMTGVGSWVKPLVNQVTVAGQTQVDVPVSIKIPKDATPGDHAGGVVAMNLAVEALKKTNNGMKVGIQRAVGARAYIRVSGATTPALAISKVSLAHDRGALPWSGSGRGVVTYTVKNTGNVRLSPKATVTLSGIMGEASKVVRPQIADLLPGQKVTLRQKVKGVPRMGKVTAKVSLTTPNGAEASGSASVWLAPWPSLFVTLGLLAAAVWGWRRWQGMRLKRVNAVRDAPRITVPADR